MPTFPIICADRDTAQEYTVQVSADNPQAAMMKAAKAGHITSRIDTGPPPAEHHPSQHMGETDDLIRQLIGEVRALRSEASGIAASLKPVEAFARRQYHISLSIAFGVLLAMIVMALFSAAGLIAFFPPAPIQIGR